jgi:hypothetical protein
MKEFSHTPRGGELRPAEVHPHPDTATKRHYGSR